MKQLLPNTDPWAGETCPKLDCPPCTQGGNQERRDNCFRRNILYEARCGVCEDEEMEKDGGAKKKEKRPKFGEKIEGKNIYVGESSRSLFERSKEHIKAGEEKREESFIAKHWQESHPDMRKVPEFRFKIVRSYRDPLTRQVGESVRIDMRKGVLNSKTMYSRNPLPRLVLEKTDKEKKYEEFAKEKEKM